MNELPGRYTFRDTLSPAQSRLRYGDGESQTLIPCARVGDPDLQVGVLSLKNLKPDRFRVRGARDRQPIVLFDSLTQQQLTLSHPGKSAFLQLEVNAVPNLHEIVQRSMNRPATRHDHLHVATVGALDEAGWQTWWTPLPSRDNPLHVRLISDRTVDHGSDPTEADRLVLAAAFERVS
jgi:hypothetical protein